MKLHESLQDAYTKAGFFRVLRRLRIMDAQIKKRIRPRLGPRKA